MPRNPACRYRAEQTASCDPAYSADGDDTAPQARLRHRPFVSAYCAIREHRACRCATISSFNRSSIVSSSSARSSFFLVRNCHRHPRQAPRRRRGRCPIEAAATSLRLRVVRCPDGRAASRAQKLPEISSSSHGRRARRVNIARVRSYWPSSCQLRPFGTCPHRDREASPTGIREWSRLRAPLPLYLLLAAHPHLCATKNSRG